VTTGYEEVYSATSVASGDIRWRPGRGEASWLAAPFVPHFMGDVIHVVRHPLAVIGSLAGSGFFTRHADGANDLATWSARMAGLDPLRACDGDGWAVDIARAASHVLRWNQMIERHARLRVRVEDLDVAAVIALLDVVGVSREPERIAQILSATPRSINTTGTAREVGWSDLPVDVAAELRQMAERYGYRS
jgi:hypothetical protein